MLQVEAQDHERGCDDRGLATDGRLNGVVNAKQFFDLHPSILLFPEFVAIWIDNLPLLVAHLKVQVDRAARSETADIRHDLPLCHRAGFCRSGGKLGLYIVRELGAVAIPRRISVRMLNAKRMVDIPTLSVYRILGI